MTDALKWIELKTKYEETDIMPTLDNALVRILDGDGSSAHPVGGGCLASPRHVVTCAHVVADALGLAQDSKEAPQRNVYLDFPLLPKCKPMHAKVLKWYPVKQDVRVDEYGDIAVLELFAESHLPNEAIPASIVMLERDKLYDRPVRMCGFPQGMESGDHLNGMLQGMVQTGLIQLDNEVGRRCVAPGFSGTPVWDKEENALVGVVISVYLDPKDQVAFIIPAKYLCNVCKEIKQKCRPSRLYQNLEAWFVIVCNYFLQKQISEAQYLHTLSVATGDKIISLPGKEEILSKLLRIPNIGKKLLFELSNYEVSRTEMPLDPMLLSVHQTLCAVHFKLDISITLLGIKFILIPSGVSAAGQVNSEPFYLADTVITRNCWCNILGEKYDNMPNEHNYGQTKISVKDIRQVIKRANRRLSNGYKMVFPTKSDRNFLADLQKNAPHKRKNPFVRLCPSLRVALTY